MRSDVNWYLHGGIPMDLTLIRKIVETGVSVGIELNGWQAQAIADAITSHSTGEYQVSEAVWPELWNGNPDLCEHVRASLRRTLAVKLMEEGFIPVSAPHEEIINPDRYVPSCNSPYAGYVRITLRVKVREAPEYMFKVKRLGETRYVE